MDDHKTNHDSDMAWLLEETKSARSENGKVGKQSQKQSMLVVTPVLLYSGGPRARSMLITLGILLLGPIFCRRSRMGSRFGFLTYASYN